MRWQRAIFSVELCIHRQHCAVNWIKVGKIIRHLRLPQFAVRHYIITDTKTTYGERYLPMTDGVYQCFQKLIKKRKKQKVDPMIDGKAGFLVLDKNGMPYLALHWEKRFEYALGKYNRTYREELPNKSVGIA